MVALERLVSEDESSAPRLGDLRLGGADAGDRALALGAASVELEPRRHLAARQAPHFLEPRKIGAGLDRARIRLGDLRLGGGDRCLILGDGIAQPRRIEPGERLALGDAIVILDIDIGDEPRLLGADVDLVGRLQIAGGGDGDRQIAAPHFLGRVAGFCARRRSSARAGRSRRAGRARRQSCGHGLRHGLCCGAPRNSSRSGRPVAASREDVLTSFMYGVPWARAAGSQPPPSAR